MSLKNSPEPPPSCPCCGATLARDDIAYVRVGKTTLAKYLGPEPVYAMRCLWCVKIMGYVTMPPELIGDPPPDLIFGWPIQPQ